MDAQQEIIERIKQQGVLPLFYNENEQTCLDIVRALYDAGIRVIEFTNRGAAAMHNFAAILSLRDHEMKDLLVGVGTIRKAEQATAFITLGADFLISPLFDANVADAAYMHKTLWIPGCMTPTELQVAEDAGCRLVKLFPGNVLGPGFIAAVKELFPSLLFMPTGGVDVTEENIGAWYTAGACAVGLGSNLLSKQVISSGDWGLLTAKTKNALEIVASLRGKS